jgi:isoquinoline 1-oxidoreductase alpha subunit
MAILLDAIQLQRGQFAAASVVFINPECHDFTRINRASCEFRRKVVFFLAEIPSKSKFPAPPHKTEILMTSFFVNGKSVQVDVDPSTPLLWVLRDSLEMTGTKFGCGMALCGACTVHLDGKAIRSCVAPLSRAEGKHVTTIEGLSANLTHPLQRAWIELDVPQCGYCQSGQIMSAAVLLAEKPKPTDEDIDEAMGGNICRCGTYPRLRRAIHRAAELASEGRAK